MNIYKYLNIYTFISKQIIKFLTTTLNFFQTQILIKYLTHIGTNINCTLYPAPCTLQKGFLKLSKNLLISYLVVFFALSGASYLFLFNPFGTKETQAAWFNDNWSFRKTLTFTHNATVSSATKVKFDIDTTAAPTDFQADCGDVRFTSPNGDILPYYYDSAGGACDTSSTDFYVLIPSIINGSNYIYMYYGNPSVVDGTRSANFSESTTTPSGGAATAGSEEKAPSPVAYWKFDDGQGTAVQDSGINNLDASIVNSSMSWKTEDNCIAGKCLANTIDGTGRAQVASNTKFQQTSNVSWNIWARMSQISSSNWPTIMSHSDTHTGYGIRYNQTTGTIYFERGINTCDGQSGNYAQSNFNGSNSFADNTWHMLTMTQDGTNINLYYDGKFVSSTADSAFCSSSGLLLYFGYQAGGSIDEAKIYNYPLSAAQVAANYNARSNPEGVAAALGANTQNMPDALSDGLVGYWKMDENTATTVTDASGNGNSMTIAGTQSNSFWATGKYGPAVSIDSTCSGTCTLANSGDVDAFDSTTTNNLTLATWYNPINTSWGHNSLSKKSTGGASDAGYNLAANGTSMDFKLSDGSTQVSQSCGFTFVATNWYHIVVAIDRSSNTAICYQNGVKTATIDISTVGSAANSISFKSISGTPREMADETRIYNRALSGAEVSQLYNWAPGPVGYWKMDEGTGTTIKDSSGNGNNSSSFSGNTTFINGKYGKALTFDGNNDGVNIPESSSIDLGSTTSSFTLGAWFNATNISSSAGTILAQDSGGSTSYISIYITDTDLCFSMDDTSGTHFTESCTTPPSDMKWHYIAGVRNVQTDRVYLYLDGVLKDNDTDTTTSSVGDSADWSIGNSGTSYSQYDFTGGIDDVKIYNYPRTSAQIIEDMNAGHPAPGSPVSSAVAHWKLDEGYGTSAQDYSGQANTLTLNTATAAWTNSGKFNKAWSGGGARRMTRTTDSDLEFSATDSFALSMWYRSDSATNPSTTEYLVSDTTANADVGIGIYANTSGNLCFGIDDDTTWGPDIASCTSTDLYDANWHHLTAVRDTVSDKTYIYIDALEKDSDSDTTTATLDGDNTFYIGDIDTNDDGEEFTGTLDEIKVYRSALTADQVKLDYNHSSSQVLGALGSTSDTQPNAAANEYCPPDSSAAVCTGPVGEWKLDEGSGTTANDSSGNGNTGTITSATYTNGKLNKALSFSNPTTSLVSVPAASAINNIFDSGGTIESWVYLNGYGGSSAGRISERQHQFVVNGGNNLLAFSQLFSGTNGLWTTPLNSILTGRWYHVAVTYNNSSTSNTPSIYINGAAQTVTTTTPPVGTRNTDAATTLYLGNRSAADRNWDGKIDQYRMFNYVRTPAQIAWDYNKGGPVAHWKMDECQGTVINDMSGNSNTGTLTIGATGSNTAVGTCQTSGAWFDGATGKRNYSMDFDGTDDLINFTSTNVIDISAGSIAMWFKPSSTQNGSNYYLFSHPQTGTNSRIYINTNATGTSIKGRLGDGTTIADITITANTWHHLVLEWNGTTAAMYVDGINRTTTATFNGLSSTVSGSSIGNFTDGVQGYTGQIDDTKIFNYPLTATQVKTLYNEGATRYGPTTGAP